jgi:hypothetical protein
MKKIFSTIVLVFFITNLFAQKPCSVISANAFYSIVMPGNMQVDENGQPLKKKVNKNRTIFISTNCKTAPTISKVIYDTVSPSFFIEKAKAEEVLSLMDDANNKIILKIAKSSFLWKLSIVESGGISITENPKTIILLWKLKNKTSKILIKTERQLATIPMY